MPADAVHPIQLSKHPETRSLVVQWSDGVQQSIAFRALRDRCPCAHCIDGRVKAAEDPEPAADSNGAKSLQLNVLSAAQIQPLDITAMKPVGNYAYNIEFSDGHSAGIYPFEFLRAFESTPGFTGSDSDS